MSFKKYGLAALFAATALLSACGGGGDSAAPAPAPAPADSRNGSYSVVASNGKQYTATMDFDARTAAFSDGASTYTTTFAARGTSTTQFDVKAPGGATGESFASVTDAVIGRASMSASSGAVAFVAARSFATTLADAAGTYNFLGRDIVTAGSPDNRILPGEITAGGMFNTCNQFTIYTVATCPSLTTYTLTVSGNTFTGVGSTATGTITFKVAKIGSDRVYLRADAVSTGNRFTLGVLNTAAYASGTFDVFSSDGQYGVSYTTDGTTTFTVSGKSTPGDAPFTVTGTANAILGGPTGLRGGTTSADGNFFSMRASNFVVLSAARGNPSHPGLIMFGPSR